MTLDCCSTQSYVTPCHVALSKTILSVSNWRVNFVLLWLFLIFKPMQNLVYILKAQAEKDNFHQIS